MVSQVSNNKQLLIQCKPLFTELLREAGETAFPLHQLKILKWYTDRIPQLRRAVKSIPVIRRNFWVLVKKGQRVVISDNIDTSKITDLNSLRFCKTEKRSLNYYLKYIRDHQCNNCKSNCYIVIERSQFSEMFKDILEFRELPRLQNRWYDKILATFDSSKAGYVRMEKAKCPTFNGIL